LLADETLPTDRELRVLGRMRVSGNDRAFPSDSCVLDFLRVARRA